MKFGRRDSLFASPPPDELPARDEEIRSLPAPRAPTLPRSTAASPSKELNAFLGRGCIYEGKLTFEGRVRIDGQFTGEIFSNDTLEVGPDAELDGEIDVACVVIAGHVTGNINARVRCDLRAPGVIVGNIISPIITMDEGVQFDGAMKMTSSQDAAVRAATRRAPMAVALETDASDAPAAGKIKVNKENGERRTAAPSRDPSELLKPVP